MTPNADWARRVRSLRVRIHAAAERAGICKGCVWWPTSGDVLNDGEVNDESSSVTDR